jgi:hypothetical protein
MIVTAHAVMPDPGPGLLPLYVAEGAQYRVEDTYGADQKYRLGEWAIVDCEYDHGLTTSGLPGSNDHLIHLRVEIELLP